jgi:hypothetical protein
LVLFQSGEKIGCHVRSFAPQLKQKNNKRQSDKQEQQQNQKSTAKTRQNEERGEYQSNLRKVKNQNSNFRKDGAIGNFGTEIFIGLLTSSERMNEVEKEENQTKREERRGRGRRDTKSEKDLSFSNSISRTGCL